MKTVTFASVCLLLAASSALGADLPTVKPLQQRLAEQVDKMIAAGHLAPGLHYASEHYARWWPARRVKDKWYANGYALSDYWHNPAETVLTLSLAIPHLPQEKQAAAKAYLRSEFEAFPPHQYLHIGSKGARREKAGLPPDFSMPKIGFKFSRARFEDEFELCARTPQTGSQGFPGWNFNPYNFYACWKYAQIFPEDKQKIMDAIRGKVEDIPPDSYLAITPHVLNQHIAGYYGYLNLQDLCGEKRSESVVALLDKALKKRVELLNKTDPILLEGREVGGFLYMTPELGDYLYKNARERLEEVFAYQNWAQPYWHIPKTDESSPFVGERGDTRGIEGTMCDVYPFWAMFQTYAHALKKPRAELEKYLTCEYLYRGDLYYIQNIVATMEAAR